MRVTILGCGSSAGVPLIGGATGDGDWGVCDPDEPRNIRTRCSIVIQSAENKALLVDTSPDLRSQLLACRIPRIDAIVFTHAHADHIAGLDDVRILNRICGHPLDAYADQRTLGELTGRFSYAFQPWKGPGFFKPVMQPRLVSPGQTLTIAGLPITVFDQDHGYISSLGLRSGSFAYSTDVVALDDAAMAALAGVQTWVVDCFQRAHHPTHAYLARVLEWTERLKPARTILTHMGPDLDWAWMQQNLPAGIEPAHDGMVLEIAPP
jgi:phosphoribosyl 1,2-cyclic phosphate phosphodiesterase